MIRFHLSTLNAVTLLVGIVQLSGAYGGCAYPHCVFQGIPKQSGVELFFSLLNINKIPANIRMQCDLLLNRSDTCRPALEGCRTVVTLPYSDRLDDPAYVQYIMKLGDEICGNLDKYLKLKDCFTDSLQAALQKFIYVDGYDIPCLRYYFLTLNKCSNAVKRIFIDLFDKRLVKNPYQRRNNNKCYAS